MTDFARNVDRTAVCLDERLCNRETESDSSVIAAASLPEVVEQVRQI